MLFKLIREAVEVCFGVHDTPDGIIALDNIAYAVINKIDNPTDDYVEQIPDADVKIYFLNIVQMALMPRD